jgi:hypothetical protein
MKSYFIPGADAAFNSWQSILIAYAIANKVSFNIPDNALDTLLQLKDVWDVKFALADNPETRTSPIVIAKNEAKQNYEKELRAFIKAFLQYNPAVTDEDRANMGLPIHSTSRKPVPVPTTYPESEVDSSVIRRLSIRFRDLGKKTIAKPYGVHGAEIRWAILSETPSGVDKLVNSAFDTHTPFTIEFKEEERGQSFYFCLRWENTRGDKGPWSEIANAKIP